MREYIRRLIIGLHKTATGSRVSLKLATDIEGIEIDTINAEDIIKCADKVLEILNNVGASDKTAKSSVFTTALIDEFRRNY